MKFCTQRVFHTQCVVLHTVCSFTHSVVLHTIYAILSQGNVCRKFTLFCRESIFVANLRTFECKIFGPQNVSV